MGIWTFRFEIYGLVGMWGSTFLTCFIDLFYRYFCKIGVGQLLKIEEKSLPLGSRFLKREPGCK